MTATRAVSGASSRPWLWALAKIVLTSCVALACIGTVIACFCLAVSDSVAGEGNGLLLCVVGMVFFSLCTAICIGFTWPKIRGLPYDDPV